ncbi:MAG: peptidoglycan-binding protein LysM [Bacteroidota bacterium]
MGLFDFLKNIGKKVKPGREAEEITNDIKAGLSDQVSDLTVAFTEGTVVLGGSAASYAAKEKAVLLAGNVEGVERVDDRITVAVPEEEVPAVPEPKFYTIQKGDSLWKVASKNYGDGNKWQALFEANREVIQDPDKIYPGQQIRIPDLEG